MKEVNLPENGPEELHPDFPRGADLNLLLDVRNNIEDRIKTMGLRSSGAGCGVGGADVSFYLGERQLVIRISIE